MTALSPNLRILPSIAGRTAHAMAKPLQNVATTAAGAGIEFERRARDRIVRDGRLARLPASVLDNRQVQDMIRSAFESEGAKRLVAEFFESELFDEVVVRLLESPGLWRLIDEVSDSPAVTAAITQNSLSFVDQVGDEVRTRSRVADDWLDNAARRLSRRRRGDRVGGAEPTAPVG